MVGIVDDGICEAGAHGLLTSNLYAGPLDRRALMDIRGYLGVNVAGPPAQPGQGEDRMRGRLVWLTIPSGRTCRRPRSGPVDRLAQNTSPSAPCATFSVGGTTELASALGTASPPDPPTLRPHAIAAPAYGRRVAKRGDVDGWEGGSGGTCGARLGWAPHLLGRASVRVARMQQRPSVLSIPACRPRPSLATASISSHGPRHAPSCARRWPRGSRVASGAGRSRAMWDTSAMG
ncbi:hypothetical protein C8Q76DRAFT_141256 [Earliella scabrosa]|nr:hypothetical protein C8Q76DRAFT_141256 [Earliella scabrosa]